jgi:hypothetical protein
MSRNPVEFPIDHPPFKKISIDWASLFGIIH